MILLISMEESKVYFSGIHPHTLFPPHISSFPARPARLYEASLHLCSQGTVSTARMWYYKPSSDMVHSDRLVQWLFHSAPKEPYCLKCLPSILQNNIFSSDWLGRIIRKWHAHTREREGIFLFMLLIGWTKICWTGLRSFTAFTTFFPTRQTCYKERTATGTQIHLTKGH